MQAPGEEARRHRPSRRLRPSRPRKRSPRPNACEFGPRPAGAQPPRLARRRIALGVAGTGEDASASFPVRIDWPLAGRRADLDSIAPNRRQRPSCRRAAPAIRTCWPCASPWPSATCAAPLPRSKPPNKPRSATDCTTTRRIRVENAIRDYRQVMELLNAEQDSEARGTNWRAC